jgi:hypothetical protein
MRWQLLPLLFHPAAVAAAAACSGAPECWSGHWPPSHLPVAVPSSKTVDGPLLGDGEAGVVLGVEAASGSLTAYVSTNSFWLLNTDECGGGGGGSCMGSHRAGIGGMTLSAVNSSSGAPLYPEYALGQSLANGTVNFTLSARGGGLLLEGTMLISQGSDDGPTTLITSMVASQTIMHPIEVSWSTWTFGFGESVTSGTTEGGVAYATRTLNGTAQPVTGVITSRLVNTLPQYDSGAQAHRGARSITGTRRDCARSMPGRWQVTGVAHPVTLQHAAGAPATSFFWNNSHGDWRDTGWRLANGTAFPNGSIALDYHRITPAGCSPPACGPPTPSGCVCRFVGAFDRSGTGCNHFTLNHAHWTRMGAPQPRQVRVGIVRRPKLTAWRGTPSPNSAP